MSHIEKEKLIKADIASIENKVRHAFNQGYDLGYKEGKANCSEIPTGSTDCISRQAVIDLMMQKWGENFSGDDAMQESIDAIRDMPSVTPIRPKGHWIRRNSFLVPYKCSECNYESEGYDNFCPNCGADMWGEEE